MAGFTDVIVFNGEECEYDPDAQKARVPCSNCGHVNEVDTEMGPEGSTVVNSFVCENCGHWNEGS